MNGIEFFNPEWWDKANCLERGLDPFFGKDPIDRPDLHAARYMCGRCPVITQCMRFSFKMRERHGIWAGLTSNERAKHLKRLREGSTLDIEIWSALRNNRDWIVTTVIDWEFR